MVDEVAPDYFKTGEQNEGAKAEKRKPNFKKLVKFCKKHKFLKNSK